MTHGYYTTVLHTKLLYFGGREETNHRNILYIHETPCALVISTQSSSSLCNKFRTSSNAFDIDLASKSTVKHFDLD